MPEPAGIAIVCAVVALVAVGSWRLAGRPEDRAGLMGLTLLGIPALAVMGVLGGLAAGPVPAVVGAAGAIALLPGAARLAFTARHRATAPATIAPARAASAGSLREAA